MIDDRTAIPTLLEVSARQRRSLIAGGLLTSACATSPITMCAKEIRENPTSSDSVWVVSSSRPSSAASPSGERSGSAKPVSIRRRMRLAS